jgi:hypothetical protein
MRLDQAVFDADGWKSDEGVLEKLRALLPSLNLEWAKTNHGRN